MFSPSLCVPRVLAVGEDVGVGVAGKHELQGLDPAERSNIKFVKAFKRNVQEML